MKDDETVGSYNIEEKGYVVCMVNKVRRARFCTSAYAQLGEEETDLSIALPAQGEACSRCRRSARHTSSPGLELDSRAPGRSGRCLDNFCLCRPRHADTATFDGGCGWRRDRLRSGYGC